MSNVIQLNDVCNLISFNTFQVVLILFAITLSNGFNCLRNGVTKKLLNQLNGCISILYHIMKDSNSKYVIAVIPIFLHISCNSNRMMNIVLASFIQLSVMSFDSKTNCLVLCMCDRHRFSRCGP